MNDRKVNVWQSLCFTVLNGCALQSKSYSYSVHSNALILIATWMEFIFSSNENMIHELPSYLKVASCNSLKQTLPWYQIQTNVSRHTLHLTPRWHLKSCLRWQRKGRCLQVESASANHAGTRAKTSMFGIITPFQAQWISFIAVNT